MSSHRVFADKHVKPAEIANLMASVGWDNESDYDSSAIERSLAAYPVIAYCRDADGLLTGYVSAFTDGAFSTFVGELVVRPSHQRRGIGSALLAYIVAQCHGIPVYATPFQDNEPFFLNRGFRLPERLMSVVALRNAA